MNKLDEQYLALLEDIMANGAVKGNRTGTDTISVFGRTIRHNMKDGFPLLTTKKVHFKSIATELFWFLKGKTDLRWLLEHHNFIWVGDAYKKYVGYTSANNDLWNVWMKQHDDGTLSIYTKEEFIELILTNQAFSEMWGDLGPIYGYQWRHWNVIDGGTSYIDQIEALISDIKEFPDSRRLMVNAWNVGDIEDMTLPPCHYGFQCYTRELTQEERIKIYYDEYAPGVRINDDAWIDAKLETRNIPTRALSLKWNQRSVDTPLGLPFNIASYGLLLTMLANECNMIADELIGDLGDTHIYENQLDGVQEQIQRESRELPTLFIDKEITFDDVSFKDLLISDYNPHPVIKFPLSN